MTLAEIEHFFEQRVTYKPGYRFRVYWLEAWLWLEIRLISAPVPDALEINEPAPIAIRGVYGLYRFQDDWACRHIAETLIRTMELHEMDEWFRVDGEWVKDPHPEQRIPAKESA